MREYRYTTPHGIEVTRTVSKANFRKGLTAPAARSGPAPWDLSFLGIRVSREVLALGYRLHLPAARDRLLRPPGGIPPAQRSAARRSPSCSTRCWPVIRTGKSSASKAKCWPGRLKPLPAAVSRRGAQQAALGVFDSARADRGIPRRGGFAPGPGRRFRLRPAVPVRADREEAAARRPQGPAPVPLRRHLLHGSQEGADRALPVRFRARRRFHARPARATARAIAPPRRAPARPDRLRPHAGRVHGQRGDGARRHAPRRLLRSGAAPDFPHAVLRQGLRAVPSACSAPAPAPTSSCCSSARSNWWARRRRCSCGWKASAWRPAPSRARRSAPAIRCSDADNIRELLKSTKEESELTMCTDVDRNDKSRVCEPGTVKVIGRRLIESLRRRVPHGGSRGRLSEGRLRFAGRVPQPHVGRDGDRRAQESGGAGHRDPGEETRAAGTAARSA